MQEKFEQRLTDQRKETKDHFLKHGPYCSVK